jgi:hypothetical protein
LHFAGIKTRFVGLNCTLLNENSLKMFEFLRISALLKKNPIKKSEFLKNKYFFNEISSRYILIPENEDFLKGKCPSLA